MDKLFDDQDANFYRQAIAALKERRVPFMVGGAFAVHHYTNCWRNTHDVDFYTTPEQVESARQARSYCQASPRASACSRCVRSRSAAQ